MSTKHALTLAAVALAAGAAALGKLTEDAAASASPISVDHVAQHVADFAADAAAFAQALADFIPDDGSEAEAAHVEPDNAPPAI